MAVMTDPQRYSCMGDFMREYEAGENFPLTKPDLRAAVNGLDDYLHANLAAVNAAIPQPARAALTARQKARLLVAIIRCRFDLGV